MSDVVERLRRGSIVPETNSLMAEAADEIEALRAENARLKKLLTSAAVALFPFGNADILEQLQGDPDEEWAKFRLLVSSYRRAGRVMSEIEALKGTDQ